MQLKDLKTQANESIKELSNQVSKKKSTIKIKSLLYIFIPILIILLILFFFNISDLLVYIRNNKSLKTDNKILKLAEETYNKGYLENSALYYQTYIDSDIPEMEKILAYKRLFEIAVLKRNFEQALLYLDDIEEIDPKINETYISKIKIFIRTEQYFKAKKEIQRSYDKLKTSPEYNEICALYYMKLEEYSKALSFLEKIPYKKRELIVHKKIAQCYLKQKDYTDCIKYIERIESKVKSLSNKEVRAELIILKNSAKILMGNFDGVAEELQRAMFFSKKYQELALRFIIYSNMFLDKPNEVFLFMQNNENDFEFSKEFLKTLGDYFIYKDDYKKALYYYEMFGDMQEFSKEELMLVSNLYFYNGDYEESISSMETLLNNYNYKDATLFKNLSICYGKIGDYQNKIFYLKEGILNFADDLDFYIRISKDYIEKKDTGVALRYIDEARKISKNSSNMIYDKRINILYLLALEQTEKDVEEKELLDFREKETSNPEFYFKLIEFYIKKHRFFEAKREIETVALLPMNDSQRYFLYMYKLITALFVNDNSTYNESKEKLLLLSNNTIEEKINFALITILEEDYNQALKAIDKINPEGISEDFEIKIMLLRAVCYYYLSDYNLSLRFTRFVLDRKPYSKKASYLKTIILESQGGVL